MNQTINECKQIFSFDFIDANITVYTDGNECDGRGIKVRVGCNVRDWEFLKNYYFFKDHIKALYFVPAKDWVDW